METPIICTLSLLLLPAVQEVSKLCLRVQRRVAGYRHERSPTPPPLFLTQILDHILTKVWRQRCQHLQDAFSLLDLGSNFILVCARRHSDYLTIIDKEDNIEAPQYQSLHCHLESANALPLHRYHHYHRPHHHLHLESFFSLP